MEYPKVVLHDGRICFGIDFFATEQDAEIADKIVRERGDTYNGGYMDGMSCGRDASWDRVVDGKKLYAVTTR